MLAVAVAVAESILIASETATAHQAKSSRKDMPELCSSSAENQIKLHTQVALATRRIKIKIQIRIMNKNRIGTKWQKAKDS